MARKAQVIGHATDYAGQAWEIRERRAVPGHDWQIQIGWPSDEPRGRGGRGVAVVLTAELARYLQATRLRDAKAGLPLGETAIKRLRAEMGVAWSWDDWWAARSDDLSRMTLQAFCDRHGCSMGAASQRRAQRCKELA